MSQLTTHVLDTSKGKPAADVGVYLYQQHAEDWTEITIASTNHDGRIPQFLRNDVKLEPGNYKLKFLVQEYFEKEAVTCFFPIVEIVFRITDERHYHVPLLISPFGYSTYRGS
jgi:5-hydroxyisourate hydrolase